MNKKFLTWMEGDGTIRTLLRKAALWDYASPERCKLRLSSAIEKKDSAPGPYLIQYAMDRRKKEVQIISHYLPLFGMFLPFLAYISLATMFRVIPHIYLGVGLMIALGIVYKYTWFCQYQLTCHYLHEAGDSLLIELSKKEAIAIERPAEIQIPEIGLVKGATNGKPNIKQFLLHELIKRECGRPNIASGSLDETTKFFSKASGCQQKYLISEARFYFKRSDIQIETSNSKTIHLGCIGTLLNHYGAIGDKELYKQCEDLQAYFENIDVE